LANFNKINKKQKKTSGNTKLFLLLGSGEHSSSVADLKELKKKKLLKFTNRCENNKTFLFFLTM
jgi:predicted alpha/beta superfamily hydrolase